MRHPSKKITELRPYAAATGAIVFQGLAVFLLLASAGEYLHPGFMASVVSPAAVILAAILAAAVALIDRDDEASRSGGWYALTAAAVVIGATWASWYVWAEILTARNALTFATGVVLAMTFYFSAREK
ncbi:hypothetical protein HY633_00265 [Candidatus Uhrbacteria bacterium]|nr:hypothetical protein [Candidatus Uhrbacteria bacterium]